MVHTDTAGAWAELIGRRALRRRSLARQETLFRQGDGASAIYLVESGRVRLVRRLEDGTSVVLHTARTSETLAEAVSATMTVDADAPPARQESPGARDRRHRPPATASCQSSVGPRRVRESLRADLWRITPNHF